MKEYEHVILCNFAASLALPSGAGKPQLKPKMYE